MKAQFAVWLVVLQDLNIVQFFSMGEFLCVL